MPFLTSAGTAHMVHRHMQTKHHIHQVRINAISKKNFFCFVFFFETGFLCVALDPVLELALIDLTEKKFFLGG